jgi:hypothetical protein
VNEELAGGSVVPQFVDDPARNTWVSTEAAPMVEAKSDEIELLSKVSFRGKTDVFMTEFGHGDEVAQDAGLKDPALRLNLNANPRNAQKYGRWLHGRSKRKGKSLCGSASGLSL